MPILVEHRERIAIITMDRQPQANALDPGAMAELRRAFEDFNRDPERWVAILTGAGDKAFCAGADIGRTIAGDASAAQLLFSDDPDVQAERYVTSLNFSDLRIWKPVIAAINGHAIGGGFELALWCRHPARRGEATLGLTEVRIGSVPALGGNRRLMTAIGSSDAMYMLLPGRRVSAQEALRTGLVSEVLEREALLAGARRRERDRGVCAACSARSQDVERSRPRHQRRACDRARADDVERTEDHERPPRRAAGIPRQAAPGLQRGLTYGERAEEIRIWHGCPHAGARHSRSVGQSFEVGDHMRFIFRRRLLAVLTVSLAAMLAFPAQAAYPDKPVRMHRAVPSRWWQRPSRPRYCTETRRASRPDGDRRQPSRRGWQYRRRGGSQKQRPTAIRS